jgi:acetoin utilization deacetylase AcuC-like enzyme
MTLFYYDPFFLQHETGDHPERAERIVEVAEHLEDEGLLAQCQRPTWKAISRNRLTLIHSPRYIDEVWAVAKSGGGDLDPDTICCPSSYDVALFAAGAVCDAVERVVRGEDRRAFCLVRPPGHHALRERAMGFCIFNNIAVAAAVAVWELGLDRVLIVDWDIHHGNGTQAAFWQDPRVGFLSIHRHPFYPGTGMADEIGEGPGKGYTKNIPVEFGISRVDYREALAAALETFAAFVKPQLVLLSAGFDTHRLDPVGNLGLETEDFEPLTAMVLDIADAYAGGRCVSVLEGGYNRLVMPDCVDVHVRTMVERDHRERNHSAAKDSATGDSANSDQ